MHSLRIFQFRDSHTVVVTRPRRWKSVVCHLQPFTESPFYLEKRLKHNRPTKFITSSARDKSLRNLTSVTIYDLQITPQFKFYHFPGSLE